MDIKKLFGTNKEKETAGTWVSIAPDVRVKVKRAGQSNKDYSFDHSKMMRPYSRQIMAGTMDMDTARQINIVCYSRHIVTDWEGITEDGKPVPFSKEKFVQFATEYPDFFSEVVVAASELQNFQDEMDNELVKKPVPSTVTG